MATIKLYTRGQQLLASEKPVLASHGAKSAFVQVDFDSYWDGLGKSAVFINASDINMPYEQPLADGKCEIPQEVLTVAGFLFIGARGVKADGTVVPSTLIRYELKDGAPAGTGTAIPPTATIYQQILGAYGATQTALAVERARINNLAKLKEGSTTGDAELTDIRVDYTGKTHSTAGGAVREQINALINQNAFAQIVINKEPTFEFKEGEYIELTLNGVTEIFCRGKQYSVTDAHTKYTFTGSAALFVVLFDPTSKGIFIQHFSGALPNKYVIIGTIYSEMLCLNLCGANYNNVAYVDTLGAFYSTTNNLATAPLILGSKKQFVEIDTAKRTVTFPDDTLIMAGKTKSAKTHYQLTDAAGNTSVSYSHLATSAVVILYDTTESTLKAVAYYTKISPRQIVVATFRTNGQISINAPYKMDGKPFNMRVTEFESDPKFNLNVKSVNHRGYADAPENTLAAYRLSKKKGFAYVECDVSFTSDGYAVLLHDSTVDRTSNGTGNIADLTLEAVRALDFGSWKGAEYAGEKIPTFDEFILLCKRLGLHPYIELKAGTEEQIKALVESVKRHGMKDKVSYISFGANYLEWVKAADNTARLGYIVDTVHSVVINTAKRLKQNAFTVVDGALVASGKNEVFIDCAATGVNRTAVYNCRNAGFPLEVWTVNSESEILALDPYISGVTSDNIIAAEVFYDNEVN